MEEAQVLLFIVKLVLGGVLAFLAIMLWSRTRDPSWMVLVTGAIVSYVGIVFDLMVKLGIIIPCTILVRGIPLDVLLITALPQIFFILAFILMLLRSR